MRCQCCGDFAEAFGKGLKPLCHDCWLEVEEGVIKNQNTNLGGGNPRGHDDDDSPGWENCVRAIEDHSGF